MNDKRRIVVGVDFSPRSRTAAEMALMLSQRQCGSIELVHVVETDPSRWENGVLGLDAAKLRQALEEEALASVRTLKSTLGCEQAGECVLFGNAAQQITQRCAEIKADLLVVGDSGAKSAEGSRRLGTTASRLVEFGPNRLLVVKPSYHDKLDRVAAAIDYSENTSDRVLSKAAELAAMTSAELFVVHAYSVAHVGRLGIVSSYAATAEAMEQLKTINDRRIKTFVEERLSPDTAARVDAVAGSERFALADYLMEQAIDLVVVGTGTTARLLGFPIGSVTHGILNDTMSSVYVIRSSD